jgi:putative transposase
VTYARSDLIDSENPGFYHLTSRCVRRAWLCGEDPVSGHSYEHRRGWVEQRLLRLSAVFSVELYGYAVMSNHYHMVIRVDPLAPRGWSDERVAERWVSLFGGTGGEREGVRIAALISNPERLAVIRERLGSVSWFMRCMNEYLARRANKEDGCTGRFWEGRYHAQALLDEPAVYGCMAYVELNPVRAGMAERIEACAHTSILHRIAQAHEDETDSIQLTPIAGGGDEATALPLRVVDYLELVRYTVERGKLGSPGDTVLAQTGTRPKAVENLDEWLHTVNRHRQRGRRAFGSVAALRQLAQRLGQMWVKGVGTSPT